MMALPKRWQPANRVALQGSAKLSLNFLLILDCPRILFSAIVGATSTTGPTVRIAA